MCFRSSMLTNRVVPTPTMKAQLSMLAAVADVYKRQKLAYNPVDILPKFNVQF